MKSRLEIAVEALRWYANQSWDTGEVYWGHGEKARNALAEIEALDAEGLLEPDETELLEKP